MQTLKRSNLSTFIQRERESLSSLWDTLYLSHAQRHSLFPPYQISITSSPSSPSIPSPNISEELLIAHEREREKWEGEVEKSKMVLGKLRKYFEVVEEMRELELAASDPGRVLGKATRGDPGRLLREKLGKESLKKNPRYVLSSSSSWWRRGVLIGV